MKKVISILATLALLMCLTPASLAEDAEYIPAPYQVADPTVSPAEYLAPVYYENENGPAIGVTLVGVIKADGLYFKDSNNNQQLDAFEDWRLPVEQRVADLIPQMTLDQRSGLINNDGSNNPRKTKISDVLDENGNVVLSNLIDIRERSDSLNIEN